MIALDGNRRRAIPSLGDGVGNLGRGLLRGLRKGRGRVSVFRYRVELHRGEEVTEEGTVLARDEFEAKEKLRFLKYRAIHLRKLSGLNAFVRQFRPDVR